MSQALCLLTVKDLQGHTVITTYHRQEASQNVSLHASMLRCNIVGNREQMFYSVGLMFSSVELFLVKVSFMIVAFLYNPAARK